MTMTKKNTICVILASLALASLLACGGGADATPAPAATGMSYTDPTSGTYKLVKDPSSSDTHLVLNLVGPSTGTAMGVSLSLSADSAKVVWVDVPAGGTTSALMKNGTQFSLGGGIPILKAKAVGGLLQATVAQKAPTVPSALNGTLLQVALELKPGAAIPVGTAIVISTNAAKCQVLTDTASNPTTMAVSVGMLTAK